jgi:hypothetical protein
LDRGSASSRPVIVDQDREWDLLVRNERLRVDLVTGPDGDDIRTGRFDFVVSATQLRGMLAAEQSAEVAQKDQDDGTISPEVAQSVALTIGSGKLDLLQLWQIHSDTMPHPTFGWDGRFVSHCVAGLGEGGFDSCESQFGRSFHGLDGAMERGAVSRLARKPAEHDDGGGRGKRRAARDRQMNAADERVLRTDGEGVSG